MYICSCCCYCCCDVAAATDGGLVIIPFLSLVQDFPGDSYQSHTKCITENEKYSAKGWQPKASANKVLVYRTTATKVI